MPPPPPPAPAPPPTMPATPAPTSLLKSIEKGTKLKKTVTNDRSAPILDSKPSAVSSGMPGRPPVMMPPKNVSNPTPQRNFGSGSNNSSQSSAPQLGGLFAGGMPKLKPTGSRPAETDSDLPRPTVVNKFNNSTASPSQRPSNSSNPPSRKGAPPPPPRSDLQNSQNSPPSPPRTSTNAPSTVPRFSSESKPASRNPPPPPPRATADDSKPSPRPLNLGIKPSNSYNQISTLNSEFETEGRFKFRTNLPPPRMYPGDSGNNIGISNGTQKSKAPPPPPPSRKGPPPPPPARGGNDVLGYCGSVIGKLQDALSTAKREEDYLKCADLKKLINEVEGLKGKVEGGTPGSLVMDEYRKIKSSVDAVL